MCSSPASGVLDRLSGVLDELHALDLESVDADEVRCLVSQLEVQARRLDAAQVGLVSLIDRRGLNAEDGHHSAKTMVQHLANLSNPEAARRKRLASMFADLPAVAAAYQRGEVGTCQVRRLARIHANPRVRERLPASEAHLLAQAIALPYRSFDLVASYWERLADEDGAVPDANAGHDRRRASLQPDFDGNWHLDGRYGSLQGATMAEIFARYVAAELEADWEKARTELGDAATVADLPRTDAQRRADALWKIFQDAASAPPGSVSPEVVVNLVMDQDTFERWMTRFAGAEPQPPDPEDPTHRCSNLDGTPLNPAEVAAAAVVGSVRRVVVSSAGVVIDLGRRVRLFQGSSRLAVLLQSHTCIWPRLQRSGQPLPGGSHRTVQRRGRQRQYQPRQRGTPVREAQPAQEPRVHHLARPRWPVAHLPAGRHRDLTPQPPAQRVDRPSSRGSTASSQFRNPGSVR